MPPVPSLPGRWHAAWAAAPQQYDEPIPLPGYAQPEPSTFADRTLRQLLRPTLAGSRVRVRLSNVTGAVAVTVTAASLAPSCGGTGIDPARLMPLRFDGASAVTLGAGAEAWSDPLELPVQAGQDLALSLYLQPPTPLTTVHRWAARQAFLAAGNATADPSLQPIAAVPSNLLLTGLDVWTDSAPAVLACFGDSLTDGTGATLDAMQRYPDLLAARIAADAQLAGRVAVLNLGIAGNRVLHDQLGPSGQGRFERDVLQQSGVTHTLVLIGINDLGFGRYAEAPHALTPLAQVVSPAQLTAGLQTLVAAAQARGLKVMLGTLLPFRGANAWSEINEAKRQQVNRWIRAQAGQLHAVVDFDMAMQDPQDPLALRPAFDSGDHLHPGDAGCAAMAAALDLGLLAPD